MRIRAAPDRLAHRLGEVEAHQEVDPRGAQLVGELVGGRGAVGPDHGLNRLDDIARRVLKREVNDLELLGGGVGARVALPQHARQRLARLVQIGQQRMKPKPA
ncbi:MAG: hypothetical protein V7607_2539 [Solirubrobacteraceae bacterium]